MTKDAVIDCVHKTIYGFFDVVADDSEEPMNEKDKLLLEVNKAVCNAIKEMPDDECKTGKWISAKVGRLFPSNDFKCSVCGNFLDFDGVNAGRGDANYCPNCGAEMKGAEK